MTDQQQLIQQKIIMSEFTVVMSPVISAVVKKITGFNPVTNIKINDTTSVYGYINDTFVAVDSGISFGDHKIYDTNGEIVLDIEKIYNYNELF